ncbi:MAG: alpha/beta fold hydrolase [Antricoccus sp.]
MSTKTPEKILQSFASTPIAVSTAVFQGLTDYWKGAIARRADPFDVLNDFNTWWQATTVHHEPKWAHGSTVVREWPVAKLLDYSVAKPTVKVPTLVLPPQAGHSSSIVDFAAADQSQMITIRNCGLDRLYTFSWLGATQATKHYSIEEYIAIIDEAIDLIGGKANLIGDCQGGWLATIYAALRPAKVNSLTIGGAPIDTHVGDGVINEWVQAMGAETDTRFYEMIVQAGNGVYSGENQIRGFKMLEPAAETERIMGLLLQVGDPKALSRYKEFTDWFEWSQDMPGDFYLWIVKYLFGENRLVKGTLEVGGETVDLSKIHCRINLLAGTKDHITPPEQVWALADYVSTPKSQINRELVEAGHLGLFMGRESLSDHWTKLMSYILPISK